MYDNLVPGGWIEIHEWMIDFQSANGSLDGTALRRWNSLVEDGESAQHPWGTVTETEPRLSYGYRRT